MNDLTPDEISFLRMWHNFYSKEDVTFESLSGVSATMKRHILMLVRAGYMSQTISDVHGKIEIKITADGYLYLQLYKL